MTELTLTLPRSGLGAFGALLQRGVAVRAAPGTSVHAFLTAALGLAPAYVERRITTVFLDGQVVDALEEAVLRDGSRLALSAAMPGLVGATLRKGGYYSSLRAAITHSRERGEAERSGDAALVQVKLFNLLLAELGPVLLARGVVLDPRETLELVEALGEEGAALRDVPGEEMLELRVRFE
jgi:hypothetical protein